MDNTLKNTVFTCLKCHINTNIKSASKGCPLCGHNLFKVSWNAGIPRMQDPFKDPYRRKEKPGDGEGHKLTEVGNSDIDGEIGTGFGSNRRGTDGPKNTSMNDTGEKEKDLPSEPVLMDDSAGRDGNYQSQNMMELDSGAEGIKSQILNPESEPIGPHNMQNAPKKQDAETGESKFTDIFSRLRRRRL